MAINVAIIASVCSVYFISSLEDFAMPLPFESPRFLLAQTLENLNEFESICNTIFDGKSHSNVVDVDPKTGEKTFKIKYTRAIPGKARHIATTAINDLRHSLDQAACDAIRVVTDSDPGLVYFPFATNFDDLKGRLRKNFPEILRPVFEGFHSYPTGPSDAEGRNLLCALSKATGTNKHQFTCKVGCEIEHFHGDSIRSVGVASIALPPDWDSINNELIVGIAAPDAHIYYNFRMAFYVAFDNAGAITGAPVVFTIRTLHCEIETIVATLEKESRRIRGW